MRGVFGETRRGTSVLLVVAGLCVLGIVGSLLLGTSISGQQGRGEGSVSPNVLLAGFGGALLVFVLGVVKELWQGTRERDGLLRILFDEVAANHRSVNLLLTMFHLGKGEVAMNLEETHMSDETWMATRIGLARHLRGADLAALTEYYRSVPLLEEARRRNHTEDALSTLRIMLNNLDELGRKAQGVIHKYVPDAEATILSDEDYDRLKKGRSLGELMEDDQRTPEGR